MACVVPHNQTSQGFTLIEIIIVIVVLGIMGAFGLQFFAKTAQTYSLMKNQKALYDEAGMAVERMSREIRDAKDIRATVTSPGKIRIQKAHGTAQDANLYVTFALNGSSLQRGSKATDDDPKSYNDLAANCSAFTVTDSGHEILLTLTLSLATGGQVTLQTKIYPKNLKYPIIYYGGRDFNGSWQEEIK